MRMRKQRMMGITALLLLLTTLFVITPVVVQSATEKSAGGTFTLNATPTVSGVDFQTDAYVTDEALDPATVWQRLNFTVATSGTMTDLLNVTIWIYDDSTHGSDYNDTSVDGIFLVEFLWVEATDTWTVSDQGSMTEWDVDTGNSDDPGSASGDTSSEFSMRFNMSQVCPAGAGDLNATVHAYDDDAGTPEIGYASESTLVTVNDYFGMTISTNSFTWGAAVEPSSTNNTHGSISVTVFANSQWELKMGALDFNATAESDVDIEVLDIIVWDSDGTPGDAGGTSEWVRNTVTVMTGTWDNQARMSDESGLLRNIYIFLNPGVLFVVGKEWTTTITVTIQADT